jgi:hypothetical protein
LSGAGGVLQEAQSISPMATEMQAVAGNALGFLVRSRVFTVA